MKINTKHRLLKEGKRESIYMKNPSEKQETPLRIEIAPKTVLKSLLLIIFVLLLANSAAVIVKLYSRYDDVYRLTRLFILNDETNIPTFYAASAFFLCAVLLSVIAATHKRLGSSYLPWYGLAAVFLLFSIDEAASVHERLTIPFRQLLNASGFLYFAWVIPYGVATTLFCVLYSRFLLRLPRKTMILFLVSGAIFISGALGLEMISARWAESGGNQDLIYALVVTCEEFLEILGISIFIYALLLYISERFGKLAVIAGIEAASGRLDFEIEPSVNRSTPLPAEPERVTVGR